MTTDFRALCAELLQELCCHYRSWELKEKYCSDAMTRAQAALAQPEPQGPTDEEIMGLMPQQMHDDLAFAARGMAAVALGADNTRVRGAMRITLNRHAVDLARAVLARWGQPS